MRNKSIIELIPTNYNQQYQLSRRVLSKLDINYTNMVKHRIKGVKRATCTIRTIQNRINVLKDAGIIKRYKFRGNRASVLMEINPSILTIYDVNPYNCKTNNQLVNSIGVKKLHHISSYKFSNTKIGRLCNPIRYNYSNLNKYDKFTIVEKMLKSPTIKNSQEYKNSNCILFYDTITGCKFYRVRL